MDTYFIIIQKRIIIIMQFPYISRHMLWTNNFEFLQIETDLWIKTRIGNCSWIILRIHFSTPKHKIKNSKTKANSYRKKKNFFFETSKLKKNYNSMRKFISKRAQKSILIKNLRNEFLDSKTQNKKCKTKANCYRQKKLLYPNF